MMIYKPEEDNYKRKVGLKLTRSLAITVSRKVNSQLIGRKKGKLSTFQQETVGSILCIETGGVIIQMSQNGMDNLIQSVNFSATGQKIIKYAREHKMTAEQAVMAHSVCKHLCGSLHPGHEYGFEAEVKNQELIITLYNTAVIRIRTV